MKEAISLPFKNLKYPSGSQRLFFFFLSWELNTIINEVNWLLYSMQWKLVNDAIKEWTEDCKNMYFLARGIDTLWNWLPGDRIP